MATRWVLWWSVLSVACAEGLASVQEDDPASRAGAAGEASGGGPAAGTGGASGAGAASVAGSSGAGAAGTSASGSGGAGAAGTGAGGVGKAGASGSSAAGASGGGAPGAGASGAGASGGGASGAGASGASGGGAPGAGASGASGAGASGAGAPGAGAAGASGSGAGAGAGAAGGGGDAGAGGAAGSGGDACNPSVSFDFEAGTQGFTHAPTSGIAGDDPWAHGSPAGISCHGGTKCWATGLSGSYGNCETAELRTPAIDLSACAASAKTVTLRFWHRYVFEPKSSNRWFDGGLVQLSADDGKTWSDVTPTPGYEGKIDGAYSGCNPKPEVGGRLGWSGTIAGNAWTEVSVDVPPAFRVAALRVRWLFGADEATTKRGWGVDDVSIVAQ